jgi:tetratricopeptide (TPR) repeat protein
MKRNNRVLLALLVLVVLPASHARAQTAANWGMTFPTSGSAVAQQHFLEGVTLMHLHMFEDAEEHFVAAQEAQPDFAMAYWGEALNQHRTIWNIHNRDAAREILQRLAATAEERARKASTAREQAYLGAVEILFGEGTQREREAAYSEAMRRLSETYPEDAEALAWYALSLMRVTPSGRTREQTRSLMASLSLEVLAKNPRHPGANRYLIQSTDDPENTDLGVIAVKNLAGVDTDAAEALHIPSHYYIQHGMWEETAEANMRAFRSSMKWVAEHEWSLEDLNNHNYGHLVQFANYGYLQSGQLGAASALREQVEADFIASGKATAIAGPLADLHARRVVDLELWTEAVNLADLADRHELRETGLWLAIGVAAVRSGNLELAKKSLSVLGDAADRPVSQGAIAALEVEGLMLFAEGQTRHALELLEQAVETNRLLDIQNPVNRIGSPTRPLKPTRELYGEVLLAHGQAAQALEQFELGLTMLRGRTNLLLGAARAATALGRTALAADYYDKLQDSWTKADADHPLVQEARR